MIIFEIGKLFIPSEQIAYVEPFDPSSSSPEFKPENEFRSRIVFYQLRVSASRNTNGSVCRIAWFQTRG